MKTLRVALAALPFLGCTTVDQARPTSAMVDVGCTIRAVEGTSEQVVSSPKARTLVGRAVQVEQTQWAEDGAVSQRLAADLTPYLHEGSVRLRGTVRLEQAGADPRTEAVTADTVDVTLPTDEATALRLVCTPALVPGA